MSGWKKAMICIFVAIEIYFIFAFAFKYKATLYSTVYGDELIENVFDEIYYSEWHPFLFRYTPTTLRKLSSLFLPGETYSEEDGRWLAYTTRDDVSDTTYRIKLSTIPNDWDILLIIYKVRDDYKLFYYYDYNIEERVLTYSFNAATYENNVKEVYAEVYRNNDIDAFFEETGLSYDYIRTQQELELDVFLDVWFEENEGLSRFNPDDLGDFTVEDVGIQGLRR